MKIKWQLYTRSEASSYTGTLWKACGVIWPTLAVFKPHTCHIPSTPWSLIILLGKKIKSDHKSVRVHVVLILKHWINHRWNQKSFWSQIWCLHRLWFGRSIIKFLFKAYWDLAGQILRRSLTCRQQQHFLSCKRFYTMVIESKCLFVEKWRYLKKYYSISTSIFRLYPY